MQSVFAIIACLLFAQAQAFYGPKDAVTDLTQQNFQKLVVNSKELWMVEFYATWCGHCKNLTPHWKKMAKALEGVVKVGAVDMDKNQAVGSPYGITGFPTIKFFGANKNKPEDYSQAREASPMVEFALKKAAEVVRTRLNGGKSKGGKSSSGGKAKGGNGSVIELTDGNFEATVMNNDDVFFVEFFAPWCGHCKNLEPHWNAAAQQLKQRGSNIKLAKVDATVQQATAGKYEIKGYPTILIFGPGAKAKTRKPKPYEGPRETDGIVEFAMNFEAQNSKAQPVVQLLDQAKFDEACDVASRLCIVTVLPHILDTGAVGRKDYLKTMKQVSENNKGKPIRYFWIEVGAQPDLEKKLNLQDAMYPAAAAFNLKKSKYAKFTRAFDTKHISEFLVSIMSGSSGVSPLTGLPFKIETGEKWDGKDGVIPVEEDEYGDDEKVEL